MDAGFWSAMRIRRKWLRDFASILFTGYYLVAAEQADEKVRKVRGMLTVDHLRVSWNKGTTPYLNFLNSLLRPRLMRYPPRAIRIPRPSNSAYKDAINGWLYFDGPLSELKKHSRMVLDVPGGGFVAMDPRTNDDKLMAWASKTGLPVLSLDYRKAPEFPYPYALNECFDVYRTIVASRGRCVGLAGDAVPKIVITGDSAGGNLAASTMLMIVESGSTSTRQFQGEDALPVPDGLILIYPGLDMNIGNWMSDEQMSLIKDRRSRKTNRNIIRRKSMQYTHLAGTPHQSDDEDEPTPPEANITTTSSLSKSPATAATSIPPSLTTPPIQNLPSSRPEPLKTRLAMASMISYFNDRILTPEMMRAMIILYIGPHNRPDFSKDYHLSPVLAPSALLARFPKTYFLTGERDPLVDDTVIFAGRLRQAKAEAAAAARHRSKAGLGGLGGERDPGFDDRDVVEVALIPGISHGFLQFVGVFPEGWKHVYRCARWIDEIFARADEADGASASPVSTTRPRAYSSGEEDRPLEMSMLSSKAKAKAMAKQKADVVGRAGDWEEQRGSSDAMRRQQESFLREQLEERSRDGEEGRRGAGGSRRGMQREKSMVSLGSEDDLLGRRMMGLAGPLTGLGDG